MKKILSVLFFFILSFTLLSCSRKPKDEGSTTTKDEINSEVTEETTKNEATKEETEETFTDEETSYETSALTEADLARLKKAFKKTNFSYSLEVTDENNSKYVESYKRTSDYLLMVDRNNKERIYHEEQTEYGKMRQMYFRKNNINYYVEEYDPYYAEISEGFKSLDLSLVDYEKFLKVDDNNFTCKNDDKDLMGFSFTDDPYLYYDFKVTLVNDVISRVYIKGINDIDKPNLRYTYIFNFKDYETTTITVPEDSVLYDSEEVNKPTSVSDLYNLSVDTSLITEGVVTGIIGNDFYLSDGKRDILVYMGKKGNELIKVGSSLRVVGVMGEFKGCLQVTGVTDIDLSKKEYSRTPETLSDVSQTNLEANIHDLVDIYQAVVVNVPNNIPNRASDFTLSLKVNDVNVDLFIKKKLESAAVSAFNFFKGLSNGSIIKISNIHVGHYNKYQLMATETTSFVESDEPAIKLGLSFDQASYTFNEGVTLDEVLNSIKVYNTNSLNEKTLLEKNQYKVDTTGFDGNKSGTYTFKYTYEIYEKTLKITIKKAPGKAFRAGVDKAIFEDVIKGSQYIYQPQVQLPTTGDAKALVVPIAFTDYKAPKGMQQALETCFFGTSEETGWESLKSYYYKSSYGKVNITGKVLAPYNTNKPLSYYDDLALNGEDADYEIIKDVLTYYDKEINYQEYDGNKDGIIDNLYLIYTAPFNTGNSDMFWAYTSHYYTEEYTYYDNTEAYSYVFMSYSFFSNPFHGKNITYNCETLIHESGHAFGLDDYYDFDDSNDIQGGLGGGDMMDFNFGDHNPYSKLFLGWIDPLIVTGVSEEFTLRSFTETGDSIFIYKDWNGSFFNECYVVDFYTPTGLNEASKGDTSVGAFSKPGIRIFHVDATLNDPSKCYSLFELMAYNNSNTAHNLIAYVEADGKNDILGKNELASDSDLFQAGMSFKNMTWYDGSEANFTLTVKSINNGEATIAIDFK